MIVDISAGGIRFASNIEYEIDEDVICHLELPGSLCFVLRAQIVRVPNSSPVENDKTKVVEEFSGLDKQTAHNCCDGLTANRYIDIAKNLKTKNLKNPVSRAHARTGRPK